MYAGNVLEVDLSNGKHRKSALGEDFRDQYIGGSALNLRLFADRCDPRVDALSPENVIVIRDGVMIRMTGSGSQNLRSAAARRATSPRGRLTPVP